MTIIQISTSYMSTMKAAKYRVSSQVTPLRILTTCVYTRKPKFQSAAWYDYDFLTLWNRILLEKLTSLQLVNKFPAFYGTQRFITTFTSASQMSLSGASLIQSILPNPTS
jgi:hypothetical protein